MEAFCLYFVFFSIDAAMATSFRSSIGAENCCCLFWICEQSWKNVFQRLNDDFANFLSAMLLVLCQTNTHTHTYDKRLHEK